MYRTHTCGELRSSHISKTVTLSGWVQRRRDFGGLSFIDLRDRYGLTQLSFNEQEDASMLQMARGLQREYVVQVTGVVAAREKVNANLATGDVEIKVSNIVVLSQSQTPPFTIEDQSDGGEELRMTYRYLDIRRKPVKEKLLLRHRISTLVRDYLNGQGFVDVETPFLIKSTPEGARDFVVPSRMNQGQFYALPQSPQTFKQLLMIGGMDRYYQIVRCFRDEDLRADRQPEFTQIDCEMAFVEQEDILNTFEGLLAHVMKGVHNQDMAVVPRMTYAETMRDYGNDKPDIRFDMKLKDMRHLVKDAGFVVFDKAELVVGICVDGCANYTRKQLDKLTDWVKRPQIGMTGMIWMKVSDEGSCSSSVNKFFDADALNHWKDAFGAKPGDLILVLAGKEALTRKAMSELRLHMAETLGLRNPTEFAPLWVLDFPLLEWDEESGRYHAMHHPFTSPKPEDMHLIDSDPGAVRANAYDLVLNGNEIGGGSIRNHDRALQARMFDLLGFSPEETEAQFGFLMKAFDFGAPPHGGVAFGFDRLVAIMGGDESIRDYIAFPKNNAGRDVMIDAPSVIDSGTMDELGLSIKG